MCLTVIATYVSKARFPFKRNRLLCVRCVNENRKKRKRWRWQAAKHGCHCFDRAFLLAGACVCCVKISRNKRKRQPIAFLAVFVYATRATQAIAFEWKPGFSHVLVTPLRHTWYSHASCLIIHVKVLGGKSAHSTEAEMSLLEMF